MYICLSYIKDETSWRRLRIPQITWMQRRAASSRCSLKATVAFFTRSHTTDYGTSECRQTHFTFYFLFLLLVSVHIYPRFDRTVQTNGIFNKHNWLQSNNKMNKGHTLIPILFQKYKIDSQARKPINRMPSANICYSVCLIFFWVLIFLTIQSITHIAQNLFVNNKRFKT